jgi:hypothetical protein
MIVSPDNHNANDERLTAAVERAAEVLRDRVPVRAAWRDALLGRIARDEAASTRSRGWTLAPPLAIAAGVALVAFGALATRIYDSRASGSRPVATVGATPVVRFVLVAPKAAKVTVVGDFNHWDPAAVPLRRLSDGQTWIVDVPLAPGRYAYGFMVDGKLEADPTAPRAGGDDFGVVNSVLMVRGS